MKRLFHLVLGALAMLAVALLSSFIAMRLAIHGREVDVPALAGLSVAEAGALAREKGINLTLENRFYSTEVPAGHVLAQSAAPGTRVRRESELRITESLGAQRVTIPDLTGQTERAATVSLRRLSLELGAVAHLPAPGEPGVVLTQTPPANSGGVDGPRVSLLISDPLDAQAAAAYVMPSLIGLSYGSAVARVAGMGLRVFAAAPDPPADAANAAPGDTASVTPAARPSGNVTAQTPLPGRRVQHGESVHLTLNHAAAEGTSSSTNDRPRP